MALAVVRLSRTRSRPRFPTRSPARSPTPSLPKNMSQCCNAFNFFGSIWDTNLFFVWSQFFIFLNLSVLRTFTMDEFCLGSNDPLSSYSSFSLLHHWFFRIKNPKSDLSSWTSLLLSKTSSWTRHTVSLFPSHFWQRTSVSISKFPKFFSLDKNPCKNRFQIGMALCF